MLSPKVIYELWQNEVDELVKWGEQANLILVMVGIQIWPVSGIQNVNCSACRRYALHRVPFLFAKFHSMSDFSFPCYLRKSKIFQVYWLVTCTILSVCLFVTCKIEDFSSILVNRFCYSVCLFVCLSVHCQQVTIPNRSSWNFTKLKR